MLDSIAARQGAIRAHFPTWQPLTLHGALDQAAARYPDRPFVLTGDQQISYADMALWSRQIAAGLVEQGLRAGEKLAIIMANYPEFIALKYAISRVGAVATAINILNRRDEVRYLLEQSESAMLVTMDHFRDTDYLSMLDEIAPDWAEKGGRQNLPHLRRIFVFSTGEARPSRKDKPEDFSALIAPALSADQLPSVDPSAMCDIIYTSGTTGSPKGVMLTHDMLTRTAFASAYARAFEDGRRILFSLPMYHVFGYVEGLLSAPYVGGAIIPQLRFDAVATLEAIEKCKATDALLIPAMSLAVVEAAKQCRWDISSLHSALASGGRTPERLWRDLREIMGISEITTGYGMTETTASTTVTRPDDGIEKLLHSNGRLRDAGPAGDPAMHNRLVDYRVVDPQSGEELPLGETGELVARGMGVTRGYYNKPAETAAAFDAQGWFKTGDLGRIDAEGYVSLLGRTKESYRCGGEQVLPSEIEDLLTSHPQVEQAHIVPIADERMGEVGVAFVVTRQDAQVQPEELIQMVSTRVARFKVPRHIFLIQADQIPTTASGRARKFLLSELASKMLAQGSPA